MESKQDSFLASSLFVPRILALVIGCAGVIWGIWNLAPSAISDNFRNLEEHVLQFETFGQDMRIRTLESPAVEQLSDCDEHAQRALLLLEIPLADAALRSGAVREFDRRIESLEARAWRLLSCVPRDSLTWLLQFGLQIEHGRLDDRSFGLLQASYETSPNEAWIGVRRMAIALPVVLAAPEPVRQKILTEFQNLVRSGFLEIPSSSYLKVPAPVRDLLQSKIDELDASSQKAFSEALLKDRR